MTWEERELLRAAKLKLPDAGGSKANHRCLTGCYFFFDCNSGLRGLKYEIVRDDPRYAFEDQLHRNILLHDEAIWREGVIIHRDFKPLDVVLGYWDEHTFRCGSQSC